jgi:hypothetical protein
MREAGGKRDNFTLAVKGGVGLEFILVFYLSDDPSLIYRED